MKISLQDIELKSFQIDRPILSQKPDLILSTEDSISDYLALGTYCLHRRLTNVLGNVIRVEKRDFSHDTSAVTAFIGNKCIELPTSAFSSVACKYVEHIANFIAGQKYFNNMILGVEISMFLSLHLAGERVVFSTAPGQAHSIKDLLPDTWDISDTVKAQEVAFTLIKKAFEVCIEPFGF